MAGHMSIKTLIPRIRKDTDSLYGRSYHLPMSTMIPAKNKYRNDYRGTISHGKFNHTNDPQKGKSVMKKEVQKSSRQTEG